MPQPPLLPALDWKQIFGSGAAFDDWIKSGTDKERQQRMIDSLATLRLAPQYAALLQALPKTVHVVAIAEDWCGDVVRHVPVLETLARASDRLSVRYITRAQHKDVFVRFLTNGGEAIPKFIFLSADFVECGNWGPMPLECRELVARGKACGDVGAARQKTSALYAADPNCDVVFRELMALVDIAATEVP